MVGGVVSVDVEVKVAPRSLWEALKKSTEILPKIKPGFFASYERLEGDGGVGTIRLAKFGPEVPIVTFAKEKVEALNDEKMSVTYSVIEGEFTDLYSLYRPTVTIQPGVNEGSSVVHWSVEYEPAHEGIPPPDMAKEGATNIFKALEAHILALPA